MGLVAHKALNIIQNDGINEDVLSRTLFYYATGGSLGVKKFLKRQQELFDIPPENYRSVPNILSVLMNVELQQGIAIALATPRIEQNPNLLFYPLEDMSTTIVAAWNKENENTSRERIIKRIRRIIIENGLF